MIQAGDGNWYAYIAESKNCKVLWLKTPASVMHFIYRCTTIYPVLDNVVVNQKILVIIRSMVLMLML